MTTGSTSGPTDEPTAEESTAGPDSSDDYGYDLAHEVKDALQIPVARKRSPSVSTGIGRPADPDDHDLGYDEAHEAVPDHPGS
jgi:hypothetical protein